MSKMATTSDLIRTPSAQEIASGIDSAHRARSEAFRQSFQALRRSLRDAIVASLSVQRHSIPRRAAHPCAG